MNRSVWRGEDIPTPAPALNAAAHTASPDDLTDLTLHLWIALAFAAAGFVKGVVGMGLPTVAIAMLSLVMAPVTAVAILVIPSLVTNVWQLLAGPQLASLARRFALMLLLVCAGTFMGIGVLTSPSASTAGIALGTVLVAYGLFGLFGRAFTVSPRVEPWLSPWVGLVTGVIAGATGLFVVPMVPYLTSLGLAKESLIQALGLSFTASTIALAAALAFKGQYHWAAAWSSLLAVLPALAGMYIGQLVRDKLQPAVFRRWFFIGLVVLGAYMLAHGVWPLLWSK